MALIRAVATVGGWTMVSRVLGFVRDAMMAAVLGAGPAAEAFVVAFRLPNLFRRLFAEGAMNAALVPIYARRLEEKGKESAIAFGGEAGVLLVIAMLSLTLLAMAGMPFVVMMLAPGFTNEDDIFALTVVLSTITFPYLTFMALSALLSGMLNTVGRFGVPAAAPVLLNVVLIAVMLLNLMEMMTVIPAIALAWGVFASGILQFGLIARDAHKAGILISLPLPRFSADIRKFLARMGPGILSAGISQINSVVSMILASLLPAGAIAHLYYADRLAQLPLGVIGVAISVALLPLLSRQLSSGDDAGARNSLNRSLETGLLFTLPASVAFVVMPLPIVDVLFQRGAFRPEDAQATSFILIAMAIGLVPVVLVKILSPAFFARGDTKTPLYVAMASMIANVGLAVILMRYYGSVGIAGAASIAAWGNAALLSIILVQRGHLPLDRRFFSRFPRLLLASVLMGAGLWGIQDYWPFPMENSLLFRLGYLMLLVGGGGVFYVAFAWLTGAVNLRETLSHLRRRPDRCSPNSY